MFFFSPIFRAVKPRAYENQENPESNPVYIYKVFASKRPVEMCTDGSPFFLTPGTKSTKCWFKKCAMGINSIYSIMNEMKKDAGIDNPRITPYRYVTVLQVKQTNWFRKY
jgi:hypothetical protein